LDAASLLATAIIRKLLAATLLSGALFCVQAETPWETAPPESFGLSRARLDQMRDELARRHTKTLVVVRGGKIVYEWYAEGFGPAKKHYTASLAKALVGGVSLLVSWNDGTIDPDDRAAKYIPAWRGDPLKSRITIRQLATHSSGVEDAEQDDIPHMKLPGWKGVFWRKDPDPFGAAIHDAPVIFEPGSHYAYSNTGMAALAYAVTASRRGRPLQDLRTLLRERVLRPLGVPDADWSVGYGQTYDIDGLPLVADWGGGAYTARAVARVGQWMLERGHWKGRQLVARGLAKRVTQWAGTPRPARPPGNPQPACGLGWYTNYDAVWPQVPRDAFAGAGAGNQILLVVPSLDLVIVRNGGTISAEGNRMFWGGVEEYLFNPLMEAIGAGSDKPPYPPSEVIRNVRFEPTEQVRCDAPGSDNWPVTWADDGDLYTSYGDGNGFAPFTEQKLSQGFARVSGGGRTFRGENIRTPTGERTGNGAHGAKASGLLMVDGVLYAWVRNTGNAQLAWSTDHGRNWSWGFRLETSFGSPAFLNFGRNYGGARDGYVYSYSQDGPSAYEPSDALVLARVPKQRIREREAYEFFVRLDAAGQPVWSRDIAERGPVFRYPGNVERVDATYDPAIGRYLIALGGGHGGGWGLYDAPTPWGPWTTAFHTRYWGLGQTHGYRLPSKWISSDGRTIDLIFSGRRHNGVLWDAFCVRRMTLTIGE